MVHAKKVVIHHMEDKCSEWSEGTNENMVSDQKLKGAENCGLELVFIWIWHEITKLQYRNSNLGAKTVENSKKGSNTVYFQISVKYEQTSLALEFLMYK